MLRFYKLIITKRQIAIARKHGESKINLKHTIFCKHMAILYVIMVAQHHTKVGEQNFPFLHLHKKL